MADTVWKTATPGPCAMAAPAGLPLFPSFNRKARRHD
jgi:hypothetical protein